MKINMKYTGHNYADLEIWKDEMNYELRTKDGKVYLTYKVSQ